MKAWQPGGRFDLQCPDVGLLLVLSARLASPDVIFPALLSGEPPALSGEAGPRLPGFFCALSRPAR